MIDHTLDPALSILYLRPTGALEKSDFAQLAKTVDPYIETSGDLRGVIVDAPAFPGWNDFGAFAAHVRFVREHHKRIRKIALVTDSALGDVAQRLASHFVAAQIRHFPGGEVDAAKRWIAASTD